MTYKTWIAVIAAFFLGAIFIRTFTPKTIPEGDKMASCKGQSEGRLDAISTFCTLVQDQLSPQECIKTDFVKAMAAKTGNEFIGKCAGTWLPTDPRSSNPTSSADFEPHSRNVEPLYHR